MSQEAENPRAVEGDNSGKKKAKAGGISADRLKSFVERIEKVEEEQKDLAEAKRDIYIEAKAAGYDTKTIRWVVQERKMNAADRSERNDLRDIYAHALGVFA